MNDLSELIVAKELAAVEAMSAIDHAATGIVFVCDDGKLLGTLTDGDIRRHILRGGTLATPVLDIANLEYVSVFSDGLDTIPDALSENRLSSIPVVDGDGALLAVYFSDGRVYRANSHISAPVVIMAGGQGTRLSPYTHILPKPLMPIGDDTITDLIIRQFTDCGCDDFWMVLGFKSELIRAYFANHSSEYSVHFVNEDEPLGTAGGLRLLSNVLHETFFLTNCDVLVAEDMSRVYHHHKESGNVITMVCVSKNTVIPYGTVNLNGDGDVASITEKPNFPLLVNSGVYVMEPELLAHIEDGEFVHITDVIGRCLEAGQKVGVFSISEAQWSDMGQLDELEAMRRKFGL